MSLPIPFDFAPMEAQPAMEMPRGPEWQYEPKWDGFRALCFRDGADVEIRSKSGQPLARYFPEMVEVLRGVAVRKFVLDGELIVPVDGKLAFDRLLQRIHPAATRIQRLAKETPSELIAFDILVNERGKSMVDVPLRERRPALVEFVASHLDGERSIRVTPATVSIEEAKQWFHQMAGGLDGIVAKRLDLPYLSGTRDAMVKIKGLRTADCVVGGFRYAQKARIVGSLLLGLYDDSGLLNHVGFTSAIPAAEKKALTAKLEALVQPPGFTGSAPGGPSRWATDRSTEWEPLKPKLVAEVQYDHFTSGRFRHGTKLLRWRPDKKPDQCTMAQVERDARSPLDLLE